MHHFMRLCGCVSEFEYQYQSIDWCWQWMWSGEHLGQSCLRWFLSLEMPYFVRFSNKVNRERKASLLSFLDTDSNSSVQWIFSTDIQGGVRCSKNRHFRRARKCIYHRQTWLFHLSLKRIEQISVQLKENVRGFIRYQGLYALVWGQEHVHANIRS